MDTYLRAGSKIKRLTGVGAVSVGRSKLYWVTVRPSAADWSIALDDSTAGGADTKWDAGATSNSSPFHGIFDPPMEFDAGIYLEATDHIQGVTFGYLD